MQKYFLSSLLVLIYSSLFGQQNDTIPLGRNQEKPNKEPFELKVQQLLPSKSVLIEWSAISGASNYIVHKNNTTFERVCCNVTDPNGNCDEKNTYYVSAKKGGKTIVSEAILIKIYCEPMANPKKDSISIENK